MLRHVGCCWLKFDHFQIGANNTQHVATHRNTVATHTKHVAPNNVPGTVLRYVPFGRSLKKAVLSYKTILAMERFKPSHGYTPKHLSLLFLIVCPSHHRRATQAACLLLKPPHTSRFLVGRQKNFTCRLECDEFRLVCDKFRACRTISDSTRSQNLLSGLVGDGQRQFVGAPAYLNPRGIVMRVT